MQNIAREELEKKDPAMGFELINFPESVGSQRKKENEKILKEKGRKQSSEKNIETILFNNLHSNKNKESAAVSATKSS